MASLIPLLFGSPQFPLWIGFSSSAKPCTADSPRTLSFSILARLSSDSLWAISLDWLVPPASVCSLISLLWAQGLFINLPSRHLHWNIPETSSAYQVRKQAHHFHFLIISRSALSAAGPLNSGKRWRHQPRPSFPSSKQLVAGPLFSISEFCPSSFFIVSYQNTWGFSSWSQHPVFPVSSSPLTFWKTHLSKI